MKIERYIILEQDLYLNGMSKADAEKFAPRMLEYLGIDPHEKIGTLENPITQGAEKMKYYVYDVYSYDIWGNKKDGFHVNDVFQTEKDICISADIAENDKKLIAALKKLGVIRPGIHAKSIEIDGETEFTLYFNDVRASAGGFCPAFEMRCTKTIQ